MNSFFLLPQMLAMSVLVISSPSRGEDTKKDSTPTTPPPVTLAHLNNVSGHFVKSGDGSITIKVNQSVQNGVTHRQVTGPGNRKMTVSVPKYTNKQVEQTYKVSDKLIVRTLSGKEADLSNIKAGDVIVLHIDKVKESKPGEKTADTHVEVKRIDVPNVSTTSPTTSAKK